MKQILDKASDILFFLISVISCVLSFSFPLKLSSLHICDGAWFYCVFVLCLLLSFFAGYSAWRFAKIIVKQDVSNENGEIDFILEETEHAETFKTKHPFLRIFDNIVNRISFCVMFIFTLSIYGWLFLGPINWLLNNDYTIQLENTDPLSLFDVLLGGVMMLVLLLIFLYVIVVHAMSQYARSIKKEIKESVLEALSEESLKIRSDIKTLSDKQ
jgi:Ca2+/Na+ antiporter